MSEEVTQQNQNNDEANNNSQVMESIFFQNDNWPFKSQHFQPAHSDGRLLQQNERIDTDAGTGDMGQDLKIISLKFKHESVENVNLMTMPITNNGLSSKQNSRTVLKLSPAMHSIAIPKLSWSDLNILCKVRPGISNNRPLLVDLNSKSNRLKSKATLSHLSISDTISKSKNNSNNCLLDMNENERQQEFLSDSNNNAHYNHSSWNKTSNLEFVDMMQGQEKGEGGKRQFLFEFDAQLNSQDSIDSFISGRDSYKKDTLAPRSSMSSQYLSSSSSFFGSSSETGNGFGSGIRTGQAVSTSNNGRNFSDFNFLNSNNSSRISGKTTSTGLISAGNLKVQRSSSASAQAHPPSYSIEVESYHSNPKENSETASNE